MSPDYLCVQSEAEYSPLTSGKHEEVFKPALAHGGGRLAGQPLVIVVQNDDLAMGIFLRVTGVKVCLHQTTEKPPRNEERSRFTFLSSESVGQAHSLPRTPAVTGIFFLVMETTRAGILFL